MIRVGTAETLYPAATEEQFFAALRTHIAVLRELQVETYQLVKHVQDMNAQVESMLEEVKTIQTDLDDIYRILSSHA